MDAWSRVVVFAAVLTGVVFGQAGSLVPTAHISRRVLDASGAPKPNASVNPTAPANEPTDKDATAIDCVSAVQKPAYPRLARISNISGTVIVRLRVGVTGIAEAVQLEGHPILSKEVQTAVNGTVFSEACKLRDLDITYQFRFEGEASDAPKTSVVFNPPKEYVI